MSNKTKKETKLSKTKSSPRKPKPETSVAVPREGLIRLPQILKIFPVSKSYWWQGVRSGKFPQSIKVSPRLTCWRAAEVWALVEGRDSDTVQG